KRTEQATYGIGVAARMTGISAHTLRMWERRYRLKPSKRSEGGLGSTAPGMGVCHSYEPDGHCISLLKMLLTNFCVYDCSYCVNRVSSPVRRARFRVDEVVKLPSIFTSETTSRACF
ncbi:MAG: hypothetical protein ACI82Z_000396, partial [Cellvibrionaceae bacterium]